MDFFHGPRPARFSCGKPVCLALVAGLAVAGCGKKPAAPAGQAAAPVPATAAATAPPDTSAALGQWTQALRKYSFEHQRVPASFNELLAAGNPGRLPAAPAGKKFAIDAKAMQVVLANP